MFKLTWPQSLSVLKRTGVNRFFSNSFGSLNTFHEYGRHFCPVKCSPYLPTMQLSNTIFYSQLSENSQVVTKENASYTPAVKFPTKEELMKFEKRDFKVVRNMRKLLPFKFFDNYLEKVKIGEGLIVLYENLVDDVNVQEFFDDFLLPDTFQSWFSVMELHVYVLCCRIMQEQHRYNVLTRDTFIDHFWDDVEVRIDQLEQKIPFKKKRKQLLQLHFQLQAAFYGYDEGLQSNDRVLAAAFWRRFFGRECSDAACIERLVKYMRVQLHYLSQLSWDDILFKDAQIVIPLSEVVLYDYE